MQNSVYLLCFLDQWIHIAVTYSAQSAQAKIYINGNINKQGPGSGRLSEDWDSYAAFGKHQGSVTDIDTLDEVYMYSRQLSPFEVKTLYDNCNFGSAKTRELTCVKYSGGTRPPDNGAPVIQTLGWGEGGFKKIYFSTLRASVWSRNKGGVGPPGPLPWIRHLPDVFNWTWEFNHRFTFIYCFPFVFQFTPKLLSSWKFLEVHHSNISSSWFYLYFKNRLTITMKILKTRINFIS